MNILNKIKKVNNKAIHKFKRVDYEISEENYERLISDISDIEKTSNSGLEVWERNRKILIKYILEKDIRDFLNWDIIQKTMFFEAPIGVYNEIKKNQELLKAIKESEIGNPRRYYADRSTSGNLIIHSVHLSKILDRINFKKIDNIIEFGGGYGSMCRLFRNLGFKSKYIIYDLPEFLSLQKFFLMEVNPKYLKNTEFIEDFRKLPRKEKTLLVATWSLSEVDLELREKFLLNIDFDWCIIGFQKEFSDIDNNTYFNRFVTKYPDISFEKKEITYIPGNYYLIGTKK